MRKRILLIVAGIIVILGIVLGIYFFVFAPGATLEVGVPNPFGQSGDRPDTESPASEGPVRGAGTVLAPRLMRITEGPVAKGVVARYIPETIVSSSATSTASSTRETVPSDVEVRYIERASGNVYSFLIHDRILTRISNRTVPGIQEASWVADGSRAFARFLTRNSDGTEHVDTYALMANGEEGYFLEQNLAPVSVQGTSTVFSLLPTTNGSIGTLSSPTGSNARTLFSSAITSLSAQFSGGDLVATTKASAGLDGYAFLVSRANGSFTRILGPLRGLATLPSPDGSLVLYSYVERGKLYTQVLNLATRTATPLPLATLVEKCTWAPGSTSVYCGIPTSVPQNLPDAWYQGAEAFSDRLWRIDLNTRLATLVVDPGQVADIAIDAVALTTDSSGDVLLFTNRIDGSLWSYDLQ